MHSRFNKTVSHKKNGQTATELAIFGTILVLVIGALINYGLTFGFFQRLQMDAFRRALADSYQGDSDFPTGARLRASTTIIEDRRMPDLSNPFGIMQRSAVGAGASAVYSRHLYKSISYGNFADLPVIDMYISGQYFVFTTAAYKQVTCDNTPCSWDPSHYRYKSKIPRSPVSTDKFNDPYHSYYPPEIGPAASWKWYWYFWTCTGTIYEDARYSIPSADYDCDKKEETPLDLVYAPGGGFGIQLMDYQDGEIDLTLNSSDLPPYGNEVRQGLLPESGAEYRVEPGTQIHKEEDNTKIVSTTTAKSADIITRIIQLNHRHTDWYHVSDQVGDVTSNCLDANKNRTCFDPGSARLYVRSKFKVDKTTRWEVPK